MRVIDVSLDPIDEVPCLNAEGRGRIERVAIPILRGTVSGLPRELDALVAAADLQMLELPAGGGAPRLVGEAVAERLVALARAGRIPSPGRTGVLLAGDLYTVPDLAKRGGSGDVRSVWRAFAERFRWVAGVLGNHDEIGPRNRDLERFGRTPGVHLLDGASRELERGLRVGGVAGIIGNPSRLNRQSADVFAEKLEQLLLDRASIVVLHDGPDVEGQPGSAIVREALAAALAPALVVCGHVYWPIALATLGPVQVLKVDARVVVLERAQ